MSQRPGSTVMPSVEITSAPAGTARAPTCPTAAIRSPSMRTTLFRMGGPAKPSTSVPPTSAFVARGWTRAGWASTCDSARAARAAAIRMREIYSRIHPMSVRGVLRLVVVNLAVLVALAVAVEGTSSLIRRTRALFREPVFLPPDPFIRHDPELGWSPRPGAVIDTPGSAASLHINAKGLRATRETGDVPPGKIRVACSGDSYTFGDGASDGATWCAQLESLDARLDAVNLGVPGYGVDQAYLRYLRDGKDLHERIHVFAFIDDDLRRLGVRRIKPFLTMEDGRLTVNNVPVPPFERPTRFSEAFDELNVVEVTGSIAARLRRWRGRPVDGPADGVMDAMLDALAATGRDRRSIQIVVRLPSPYAHSPYSAAFLAA